MGLDDHPGEVRRSQPSPTVDADVDAARQRTTARRRRRRHRQTAVGAVATFAVVAASAAVLTAGPWRDEDSGDVEGRVGAQDPFGAPATPTRPLVIAFPDRLELWDDRHPAGLLLRGRLPRPRLRPVRRSDR